MSRYAEGYASWPEAVKRDFDSGHGRVKRLRFTMNHATDPAVKLAAAEAILAATTVQVPKTEAPRE